MKIQKAYETRLETCEAQDIVAILDAKLEATSPNGVVDYISFAIDNLNDQVRRMKDAKAELDRLIKMTEVQKDIIKTGGCLWLTESGLDKLDGDIVSSISVYVPKAKEVLRVTNEEALINEGYFKMLLDKTAVKNAILNGEDVNGAEIEIEHQTDSLRINKRR